MKDIENAQRKNLINADEFKVRDAKLNPILKNTLFEMMNKDPSKRLELHETKRRLSLQKYIASESKKWGNSLLWKWLIDSIWNLSNYWMSC